VRTRWGDRLAQLQRGGVAGGLLLAILTAACGDSKPALPSEADVVTPARPGRIILVSLDTVRADRLSLYADIDTTPNLLAMAEHGVVFRSFHTAANYTLPATMSMLTGLDPYEHGVVNQGARLGRGVRTLAERLRAAGYRTRGLHEGGYVDPDWGFDRGFDEYVLRPEKNVLGNGLWGVLDWMREMGDTPYFLFLHTYAAHHPYGGLARYRRDHPERGLPSDAELAELRRRYPTSSKRSNAAPPEIPDGLREICTLVNELSDSLTEALACGDIKLRADSMGRPHFESDVAALRESYDVSIRRLDRALGLLRDTLMELGKWEDTLLVVTSDHGEAFFEHRMEKHDYVPFQEVLRVPLLMSWPRGFGGGRVIDGPAWHLDLVPTLLSLTGLPAEPALRGHDLTPVLRGEAVLPTDRALFPWVMRQPNRPFRPPKRVALGDGHKLIEGHAVFGDPEGLLFDLRDDPGETRNLREEEPERAAALRERLAAWQSDLEPGQPVHQRTGQPMPAEPTPDLAPFQPRGEQLERLRALGYL
jgi:arylsulfatase A-like enzyme